MISFVIPAYNAENTIEKAVKSILNQKNSSLQYEIIIVNDGSKDNTKIKVQELIKSNDNIYLYEEENLGVSQARNLGVSKANGDYIIFVDSDDYISENLLHDIETYINQKVDLIKWNLIIADEDGKEISKEVCYPFQETTGIEGFNELYGKDKLIASLCNYAIKKELLPLFPANRYHEDFRIMPLVILKAPKMVSLDKNEYYYVMSKNSIMRNDDLQKQRKKLEDMLINFDEFLEEAKKLNLDKFTHENLKIYVTNSMFAVIKDLEGENKSYYIQELKKRKIAKYIKMRNCKQIVKRILLEIKGF